MVFGKDAMFRMYCTTFSDLLGVFEDSNMLFNIIKYSIKGMFHHTSIIVRKRDIAKRIHEM